MTFKGGKRSLQIKTLLKYKYLREVRDFGPTSPIPTPMQEPASTLEKAMAKSLSLYTVLNYGNNLALEQKDNDYQRRK